ncbi:SemiSWEET family transporter [Actinoplanes sp. NPDC051851]|uniref:SemiSWEET family sugar transporter n=1 Tax=Actinoplanes sp. NPDC051851 TaxID=3154753 RepID=UPI003429CD67
MSLVITWMTTCWALVMALSPLLQVRIVLRHRDATGASVAWPSILLIGSVLWLLYGLLHDDLPLIIANVVSVVVCLFTVGVLLRYRPASPRAARAEGLRLEA